MYRQDAELEIADIKLRLFVAYCKDLPRIANEVKDINRRISSLSRSGSIICIKHGNAEYESRLLDLISEKERAMERYSEYVTLIKSVRKTLINLDPGEVKLLQKRYELNKTLRQIGIETNYSYMNVSRKLDDILWRFAS